MNNHNKLSAASTEKLIKKRDLLKGVSIGFGIVFLLVIAFFSYLFATKGLKNVPLATLIPVFTLPVMFMPLLANLSLINKEINTRKHNQNGR